MMWSESCARLINTADVTCIGSGYPLAKISDMGLARLTTSQQNYVKQSEGGVLPVRWMAPETLQQHGVYTEASDVWGFGVCGMHSWGFLPISPSIKF